VSFVPDGTPVNGSASNLFQLFQHAGIPAAVGQDAILKALQTWAVHTPVNLILVADQGQAVGVSGSTQGDAHFGDIRIAARPMATNVLAVTEPPGSAGDTRQGDIVLNSNMLFNTAGAGGYDLFSAMLQEAGHAFGIGNSDEPASPMFEQYSGARQGLTANDIADVKNLYGSRPADSFEHSSGNETLAAAAVVASASSRRAGAWVFHADLNSQTDADAYRFTMPSHVTAGATTNVRLATTGVSLANARIRVFDENQQLIGEATDSHFSAGLTVNISEAQPGKTYYFSVNGAEANAFAVGGYRVKLVFDPAGPEATVTGDSVPARQGSNNLLGSALSLVTPSGYDSRSYYRVAGRLDLPLLADWYKFQSAPVNGQAQSVATVTIRTLEAGGRPPAITVTDTAGRSLNAELVSSTADSASYQFFAPADQTLHLKVATSGLLYLSRP